MNKFKKIFIQTSILTGALFFCLQSARANNDLYSTADSILASDTIKTAEAELHKDTIILESGDALEEISPEELARLTKLHSPHKATIYSAVIPGLGQAYNRKYWKIPIIYLAGYYMYSGFGLNWGWKFYNDLYQENRNIVNTADSDTDVSVNEKAMSYYREKRDKIVIYFGILYFANIVDAMADAHFFYYDISDDLSVQLAPAVSATESFVAMQDFSYGLKLRLKF